MVKGEKLLPPGSYCTPNPICHFEARYCTGLVSRPNHLRLTIRFKYPSLSYSSRRENKFYEPMSCHNWNLFGGTAETFLLLLSRRAAQLTTLDDQQTEVEIYIHRLTLSYEESRSTKPKC